MIKEIGSDFFDIELQDSNNLFFNDDVNWFISGRSALDFILKDIKRNKDVKTILVPSYICDTILEPIIRNGLEIKFYSVIVKDNCLFKCINEEADILLNIDYFGYTTKQEINFNGIVINDVTHSVFVNKDNKSDYVYGSLRKWSGFLTGGFAYSNTHKFSHNYEEVPSSFIDNKELAQKNKLNYISEVNSSKDYLDLFKQSEDYLSNNYQYGAYKEDIDKAKHLNIDLIREKRKENANYLIGNLKDISIYKEVKEDDCPLFVPIIVENRDKLRKYLIDKKIYCPVHWPLSNYHKIKVNDQEIYQNELSLICDQRYNLDDMKYIVDVIKEF